MLTLPLFFYGQNDLCENAIVLMPNSFCSATQINMGGATINSPLPVCVANATQDVWFQFVANGTSMTVQINAANGVNNGFEIFQGSCNGSFSACINTNSTGSGGFTAGNFVTGATYFVRVFNAGATPISEPFYICVVNSAMGMGENESEAFHLFPNPGADVIYIDTEEPGNLYYYQILNLVGQVISKGEVSDNGVTIQNLESGIYYLRLWDGSNQKIFTRKFIKR